MELTVGPLPLQGTVLMADGDQKDCLEPTTSYDAECLVDKHSRHRWTLWKAPSRTLHADNQHDWSYRKHRAVYCYAAVTEGEASVATSTMPQTSAHRSL